MIIAHDAPTTAAHQRDLPGLDGLRAIAVILVILAHSAADIAAGSPLRSVADNGSFGVTIFFVLSGYLITYLLLREEDRMGRIDLGRFYMRRAIRIIPPMYLFVATIVVLAALGGLTLRPKALASLLFFFGNLVRIPWATGHLWSLAVEEHFYLAWPLVFVACRGPRSRAWAMSVAIVSMPVWRWVALHHMSNADLATMMRSELRGDAILMGCLLALATKLPSWERGLGSRPMTHPAASCLAVAVLVATFTPTFDGIPRSGLVGPTLQSLCVALVINQVVRDRGGWPTRCLSLAAVAWLGRLSYSVYLWQQMFCSRAWPAIDSRWLHLPWNLIPIAVTAMLSYYLVETPLFRLRARFRPVRPRSPDSCSDRERSPRERVAPGPVMSANVF
jgi:peptidoglycan/LPS O-acetylase OafA/YrhL